MKVSYLLEPIYLTI